MVLELIANHDQLVQAIIYISSEPSDIELASKKSFGMLRGSCVYSLPAFIANSHRYPGDADQTKVYVWLTEEDLRY
jgi:hypothetical protein